jgi:hypothetical protein
VERIGEPKLLHGHRSGGRSSPTYQSWHALSRRPDVCAEWTGRGGFARFLTDVGERPGSAKLVRPNPLRPWARKNCEWQKQQAA